MRHMSVEFAVQNLMHGENRWGGKRARDAESMAARSKVDRQSGLDRLAFAISAGGSAAWFEDYSEVHTHLYNLEIMPVEPKVIGFRALLIWIGNSHSSQRSYYLTCKSPHACSRSGFPLLARVCHNPRPVHPANCWHKLSFACAGITTNNLFL